MINAITGLPNRTSHLREDVIIDGSLTIKDNVIIDGSLTINNGTQAAGLVLTSNSGGTATWQAISGGSISITGGTFSAGTLTLNTTSGATVSITGFTSGGGDTYWVSGSSGNFSIKANNDSLLDATGDYAVAEGNSTTASNFASHAEGYGTTASAQASHAEGFLTTASGNRSHSEGYETIASAHASHAEGNGTTASGEQSHAGGIYTKANGDASFVHGNTSQANGINTIVLGANIIGNQNDTTYVDHLNIKTLSVGASVTNLGIDSNGNVVSGTTGGSGSTGLAAYGYAVGQSSTTIGADSDVVFDLGATPFPNAGMTVPAPAGTSFTITTTGHYEFEFYIVSTTHAAFATTPLVFAIYKNGAIASVAGNAYEFRGTFNTTDANQSVRGQGIIALTAGDVITLHNRTNTVTDTVTVAATQTGVEASPNRTLSLKKLN